MLSMSYPGDMGDGHCWAVGRGKAIQPILEELGIPYTVVDEEEDMVKAIQRAYNSLAASRSQVAILFAGDTVLWGCH